MLALTGSPAKKSYRDAIGSWIHVRAGNGEQVIETKRGRGFLGCSDPRVHIGLGDVTKDVRLTITWPNGERTKHTVMEVDREIRIAQE